MNISPGPPRRDDMRPRMTWMAIAVPLLIVAAVSAQQAPPARPAGRPPVAANDPQFDQDAVARGQELFISQCGFCHGSTARGGSTGPDLTRSELVQSDEG